ncbi:SRPBCC family protein [[Kitasatospora] papulosa]|uniref:SRPBCC family protein n=1 Tax=[Kitasatospora] papulosa TaxID=1464011 RepID=UPI0035DD14F0
MAESTLAQLQKAVAASPAADRLKDELKNYVESRAQHTVSHLGRKLGEGVTALGDGDRSGGVLKSLSKGGRALAEGKSPARAALSAGTEHVKDAVKDKVKSVFGGGRKSGGGKSTSVLISEDIDIGVPIREAYDQWTQFQEFSTFAKGVVSVDRTDDTSSNWTVKVAKSTRSWKANVTEQVPDERISWTTEGAKGTVKGVVTFHRITDDLTRVLLVLEYFPKGLFEKTGNIWRAQGRRARLDLKLYRKFIMMRGEASDGWRGEIRDGEVVVSHDQAVEDENLDDESSEDEYDDAADADGEPGPDEDEAYEDEAYEEDDGSEGESYEDDPHDDEAYEEDDEDAEDADDTYDDTYDEDDAEDEDEPEEAAPRRGRSPARR